MAACFEFHLISEGTCHGQGCTGFRPPLQRYFCYELQLHAFHLPWLQNGWQFTLAAEMQIPSTNGRPACCAGQGLLQLSREKTCWAAWPSSPWVAWLREHVASCQEVIVYWVWVLALLKEGNLLLGKCQTALSSPNLQSNQIVKEIAQVYKCTYLCVICWEVLWLGCSLILW